jgi:uncharacterized protein (DUF1499 family)
MIMGAVVAGAILLSKEEFMLAAFYESVFGSPDLGATDLETFRRPSRPNTALACPVGFCANAVADFDPGIYPVSEEILRDAMTKLALSMPFVIPVYRHAQAGLATQDRYVQRTARMQFPDTVEIRFIPVTETSSTLAIYSRSQIGYGDQGVNLARIRHWTSKDNLGLK